MALFKAVVVQSWRTELTDAFEAPSLDEAIKVAEVHYGQDGTKPSASIHVFNVEDAKITEV